MEAQIDEDIDGLMRHMEMFRVCRGERDVVEGIYFDLNHPALDRTEWEPITVLGDLPGSLQPLIVFPWTTPKIVEKMRERYEPVVVEPGDAILVLSVSKYAVPTSSVGALDHPHHKERRLVYLGLKRADGTTAQIPGSWMFAGVADVMTPIALHDDEGARGAMVARFERVTGVEDILEEINEISETDWNARFKAAPQEVRLAAKALWTAEDDPFNTAVYAGMTFGYLIGRAEGRLGRKVQAKSAAKRPRKTGDAARAAAITEIESTPRIVLKACATRVASKLNKSVRSIEETIAVLFAQDAEGVWRPDTKKVETFRAELATRPSDANP